MRRFLVNMSNGLCGCDEEFLFTSDTYSDVELWENLLDVYTYTEGFAGSENYEAEAFEEGFECLDDYWLDQIEGYSSYEEISEEEYQEYLENGYEERS